MILNENNFSGAGGGIQIIQHRNVCATVILTEVTAIFPLMRPEVFYSSSPNTTQRTAQAEIQKSMPEFIAIVF